MVNDIPEQYKIAESLLEKYCTQENPGFISLIVCCELDWVLRKSYKYSREQVHGMFVTLLSANDLEVENFFLLWFVLEDYKGTGADLADLFIAEKAERNGCRTTYTFDKKAAKRKGFTLAH